MPIIEVNHLTKEFRLGALQGLKQTLLNTGARLMGRPVPERPLFKALDDVSFSIDQGEVVGIIGHNGAGKSTLLKMLAGISTPSTGSVKVHGRVAPLIEVGAGFVPDFTGRENVYLNGAILGMSRREIDRKFEEIVDFAEIAEFIDTPVKRYSSGMQVKLAFAVATSVESDILIVDEVLAVGDIAFQRKCFDRMSSLIKGEGRTVLVVSHSVRQIERICSRALMLNHGRIVDDGNAREVCNAFLEENDRKSAVDAAKRAALSANNRTLAMVEIESASLFTANRLPAHKVVTGQPIQISIQLKVLEPLRNPLLAIGFQTTDLLNLASHRMGSDLVPEYLPQGTYQFDFTLDSFPLMPGAYGLRLSVTEGLVPKTVLYAENILSIVVVSPSVDRANYIGEGFFSLDATWSYKAADSI